MQKSTWNLKDLAAENLCSVSVIVHDSIESIPAHAWNALAGTQNPSLRHEYFMALEASGAVGPGTGWVPCYLTLHTEGIELLGAVPLFEKTDSRGEFIFDWSWATALEQSGRRYYPKLVAAVPFTPIPGPRILLAPQAGIAEARAIVRTAMDLAAERNASSIHWLFASRDEVELLEEFGHVSRTGCHFEWQNPGVATFDEWLGAFTSARRKNVRRERRRIAELDLECRWLGGSDLDASDIGLMYRLYSSTYYAHGMRPYLSRDFFDELTKRIPENLSVCFARRDIDIVAGAFCLEDTGTLYGRYWGCFEWVDSLHFELCYYQGIEYSLAKGLERFHPGVQGEHKLLRGFAPTMHYSAHWLRDEDLRRAVAHYVEREQAAVSDYVESASDFLPFRRTR